MRNKTFYLLMICLFFLSACDFNKKQVELPNQKTAIANPASVNCQNKGGKLLIKQRPDGGQYGVCFFEDNRQCEEWALLRDECPIGGFKITGYDNEAQIYCAITGGIVSMAEKTCSFSDGMVCDTDKYFSGQCLKNGLSDLIRVDQPTTKAKIISPLVIKGEVRGSWFFEASFPVKLTDANGKILAQGIAQAQSDWMTTDFVSFAAQLKFSKPSTETGSLILSKDNPSGLPVNDNQIIIPVIF